MGDPACNSGDREEDGIHISRESHGSIDKPTVEVNVGVELATDEVLIRESDLFEFESDFDQRLFTANFKHFESNLNRYYFTFLTILARGS